MSYLRPKIDLYESTSAKVIANIEMDGVGPWMRPWSDGNLHGRVTLPMRTVGLPYKGINTILLWSAAFLSGYENPIWMTYKEAQRLGGQVRAGEKGEVVVYANRFLKTETDAHGVEVEKHIPFLKPYTVFNAAQVDHLPARFYEVPGPLPLMELPARLMAVDAFVRCTGAVVKEGGNRAYFAPGPDRIQMPPLETFRDRESYYSTLGHELTHWTGHKDRLDRDMKFNRQSDDYKSEELVAEMGAAFLCAAWGISAEPRIEHAQYIAGWIRGMREQPRLLFRAAAKAQQSTDWLIARQPGQQPARPDASESPDQNPAPAL